MFEYIHGLPIPACVIGEDGNITEANSHIDEVVLYDDIVGSNFFALTGVKRATIVESMEQETEVMISRNEHKFVLVSEADADPEKDMAVFFIDKTSREELRSKNEKDRPVMVFINIDNYDELISSTTEDSKRAVPVEVDRIVRRWAEEYDSPILSIEDDKYVMFSNNGKALQMIDEDFSVLDEVRKIEAMIDFPVSVSMGMGIANSSMLESRRLAEAALELALGRGGDQAVVKDEDHTSYYGGKLQTREKNNKGKARVIAHAVKHLIRDSEKVIIMGHFMPDMDSFGACLGAYSICRYLEKKAYIVVNEHNDALESVYEQAESYEEYPIIKNRKALELADENTLLFVVDTHRPKLLDCPELADICRNKIVIDHHRLSDDAIENATVSYIESYASSASELITEILQYIAPKKIIRKFEAEALLAGIMVDTNSYSVRSGVRTFEASAWLRRAGADATEVKRFFQSELDEFRAKAKAVAGADFTAGGIVYAMTEGHSEEQQIINAKVADELLSVKGTKASFVIGTDHNGRTIVSARSLGDINVQFIMEKFGGGGHLNAAAAQTDESVDEVLEEIRKLMNEYEETEEE